MSKQVHVICDHDALYGAIELKLSCLPQLRVTRLETNAVEPPSRNEPQSKYPAEEIDLIIVAPVPPLNDPMSILAKASLLNYVGRVPVLIISDQPSKPSSDDKITYLNFPFDSDDLTATVAEILSC
ncbi:MAG: hypothetical protein N2204_05155 [Anaerolineae bacterium]|nr:hypothetical protein [Anaerolineae bacterium]